MIFNEIRNIINYKVYGEHRNQFPISLEDDRDSAIKIVQIGTGTTELGVGRITTSDEYYINTVDVDNMGVYGRRESYLLVKDGEIFSPPVNESYVMFSVHDVANKKISFGGDSNLVSGFIRFRLVIEQKKEASDQNPRYVAGLIADAIDRKVGFCAGHDIPPLEMLPGESLGTLMTSAGSLTKVEEKVDAATYNIDFQFDYYK